MKRPSWLTLHNFAWVENASLVALFFIAMPLKYMADFPAAVSVVGMIHGVLFMVYCGWVLAAYMARDWSKTRLLVALVASVIPFAPFFVDLREIRPARARR